jgi:hypothetical protein
MKSIAIVTLLLGLGASAHAAPHGLYFTQGQKNLNKLLQQIEPPATTAPNMLYYGGPVISHVKAYSVMWGKKVSATTAQKIGGFLAATVDSNYMDWLTEYKTDIKAVDGRDGTNQDIGRGTYGGQFVIDPQITLGRVDDKDIQAELERQIAAGNLPKPDGDSLFMIYFPPGVSITIEGMSSCQAFCAYHEGFVSKEFGNVYYGVMPDLGGACLFGCGFFASRFDALTNVSSHELTEAVTDPFPTPADQPAYPQAWNMPDGQEIGDVCATRYSRLVLSDGTRYVLQAEWDNHQNGCRYDAWKP